MSNKPKTEGVYLKNIHGRIVLADPERAKYLLSEKPTTINSEGKKVKLIKGHQDRGYKEASKAEIENYNKEQELQQESLAAENERLMKAKNPMQVVVQNEGDGKALKDATARAEKAEAELAKLKKTGQAPKIT